MGHKIDGVQWEDIKGQIIILLKTIYIKFHDNWDKNWLPALP